MRFFQKNLDYFYEIVKSKKSMNRGQFAELIGVSRGTYFRMAKEDKPLVTYNKLEKIVEAFNKETGHNVSVHDFMEKDLRKKFPLHSFYEKKITDDKGLFTLLKDLRKISFREVAKMSEKLFVDKDYHLTPTYIQRLEKGDYRSPSLKKLQALATIYRVPVELFIAERESPYAIQRVGNKLIIDIDKISNPNTFEEKVKELFRQEPKTSPTPNSDQKKSEATNANTATDNM